MTSGAVLPRGEGVMPPSAQNHGPPVGRGAVPPCWAAPVCRGVPYRVHA